MEWTRVGSNNACNTGISSREKRYQNGRADAQFGLMLPSLLAFAFLSMQQNPAICLTTVEIIAFYEPCVSADAMALEVPLHLASVAARETYNCCHESSGAKKHRKGYVAATGLQNLCPEGQSGTMKRHHY